MAIFVTGLTGGAKEEPKDIEMTFISGNSGSVFSTDNSYIIIAKWNIRINENITNIGYMFKNQGALEGIITLNCYPTEYNSCFSGTSSNKRNLRIDYTTICTNIDNIIATGSTSFITKGYLVD